MNHAQETKYAIEYVFCTGTKLRTPQNRPRTLWGPNFTEHSVTVISNSRHSW